MTVNDHHQQATTEEVTQPIIEPIENGQSHIQPTPLLGSGVGTYTCPL